MIDARYLAFLGVVTAATSFLSLFNSPNIRGFRNFGFLTIYLGTIVWLFFSTFIAVACCWFAFGAASGLVYYLYEVSSVACSKDQPKEWPTPIAILHSLVAWPIMLPEVIEYILADIGILKVTPSSPEVNQQSPDNSDQSQ